MIRFRTIAASGAFAALILAAATSCRRPKDTVKSDLIEAGYPLTADGWFRATASNDVSALKQFAASGFDLTTRNTAGDSALHAAAAAGAKDAADFLLDRGMQVDTRGAGNRTPLMSAALADQPAMIRWLVQQGANPGAKDDEGFEPLMLAVRENKLRAAAELAPLDRGRLDSAILLASLEGHAGIIDVLTNYGASVFARMDDGRTPLMIAAENGRADAVAMLLDIGAGRHAVDDEGKTAADLATAAGHPGIAELINRDPKAAELSLEPAEEIAKRMEAVVDAAMADTPETAAAGPGTHSLTRPRSTSKPIAGEVLSAAVAIPGEGAQPAAGKLAPSGTRRFSMPPLVMRLYQEREMPVRVTTVTGDTASLRIQGKASRQVKVRTGDTIPGSSLMVIRAEHRVDHSKLNEGRPTDVSLVEVRDTRSGSTRQWIAGVPANAHDPVALVEDAATGKRYTATPGQRFTSTGGGEFIVTDVRPNQIVIEEAATGATQTLPLRGPRG